MNLKRVATLADAFHGLKLALRSRVGLQPDAVDFDNPRENFRTIDRITEDVLSLATEDLARECFHRARLKEEGAALKSEVERLTHEGLPKSLDRFTAYPEVSRLVTQLKKMAPRKTNLSLLSENEKALFTRPESLDKKTFDEYNRSAIEMVVSMAVFRGILPDQHIRSAFFVPRKFSEKTTR